MKKIVHLSFLVFILLFAGCEKVLEIEDDPSAKQLVLNAVPKAGDTSFVYFAHTRFFLDTAADQPVALTAMTLTVNGIPYTPDSVSRCRYFFFHPIAGWDSLTIDVDAVGSHVHARTYVPLMPEFSTYPPRDEIFAFSLSRKASNSLVCTSSCAFLTSFLPDSTFALSPLFEFAL